HSSILAKLAWKVRLFVVIALGLPWLIFAQLTGEAVFTGLGSFAKKSDSDREWLGRAAGWDLFVGLGWIVTVLLVYSGSAVRFLLEGDGTNSLVGYFSWIESGKGVFKAIGDYLAPVGGISAVATALLGSSSLTGGPDKAGDGRSPIARLI